jgi:peptide/nickel transport system substrate-binding protein
MDLFKSKFFPLIGRIKKSIADSRSFVFGIFSRKKNATMTADNSLADKKLIYSLSKSKIPNFCQLKHLRLALSKKESLLLKYLLVFIVLNVAFLGLNFGRNHLRIMPVSGGQYFEALVGSPARINPLYASLSDTDNDISRFIYSSLFKYDGNGQLIKDLVEDYQISPDGKIYTIKIRNDVKWHNGEKLTADDVIFTFEAITDSAYNSPLRASFSGVDISKQDDQTVVFTISEKYAPFLSLLTFGIMPVDLWEQIDPQSAPLAELNLKPIGSGPYQYKTFAKDKSGNIKSYTLSANKNYYGKKPYIKEITLKFYSDSTEAVGAFNDNNVDGLNFLAKEDEGSLISRNSLNIFKINQPRIKAIFLNQSANASLKNLKVRQALALATPRQNIIDQVLNNEAIPAYGPIPADNFAYNDAIEKYNFDSAHASSLLEADGWKKEVITLENIELLNNKKNQATSSKEVLTAEEKTKLNLGAGNWLYKESAPVKSSNGKTVITPAVRTYLILNLTIIDNDDDGKTADLIKINWEKLGVKTNIVKVPAKQIQSDAIKPKTYEALLFSEMIGNDPDVYAFWHSSQAGANGLNLSNYKNEEVDKMLEEGRLTSSRDERIADYKKFQELIANDAPAIFLYSPNYLYVQNKKIKGFAVKSLAMPADRFTDVSAWYMKTGERLEW